MKNNDLWQPTKTEREPSRRGQSTSTATEARRRARLVIRELSKGQQQKSKRKSGKT